MVSLFRPPAPALPQFRSLLIRGSFSISSLVYLCISCLEASDERGIVIFTPSRVRLGEVLSECHDASWLFEHGGDGAVSSLLRRVRLVYVPTPEHLRLCLSMLHVSGLEPLSNEGHKLSLELQPSLLVLHDLSLYFLANPSRELPTISSYLNLALLGLDAVSHLSGGSESGTAFAILDSRLDELHLPLFHLPPRPAYEQDDDDDDEEMAEHEDRLQLDRVNAFPLLSQYFEWTGIVQRDDQDEYTLWLKSADGDSLELAWDGR